MLFALNSEIANLLCLQFEQKQTEKQYLAVVRGYVTGHGEIDYPLKIQLDKIADKFSQQDKAPQSAVTFYEGLQTVEMPYGVGRYATSRYSLVRLVPKTGAQAPVTSSHEAYFSPDFRGYTIW